MAVNAYLQIDGVEGPSTSKEKCIDILSFSSEPPRPQPMAKEHPVTRLSPGALM